MTSLSREQISETVERYVRQQFYVPDDDPNFGTEVNLWEEGYIDSTGVVELIAFLESEFKVTIPESHLFSPDFTRIDGIVRIIQSLKEVGNS